MKNINEYVNEAVGAQICYVRPFNGILSAEDITKHKRDITDVFAGRAKVSFTDDGFNIEIKNHQHFNLVGLILGSLLNDVFGITNPDDMMKCVNFSS